MKKIIGVLAAVGVALALVGCDTVTPTGGSLDLVATWTNVSKQYVDLSTTPAASTKEGTWTSTSITYPTVAKVYVNVDQFGVANPGVTTTVYGPNDTETTTTTTNLVIQASGSYVKTTTVATVWTARAAAPANTATVQYQGTTAAIYAGSKTVTTTETVTVSVVGSAYKEEKVTTVATVYTGAGKFSNVAYVAADNTTTTVTTTPAYVTSAISLSYNTADGGTMTQTVFGKTIGAPTNVVKTITTTRTWTFAKDGTYTATSVVLTDQPAIAAVAATANSAEVLATAAGTTTQTTTTTGTYSNQVIQQGANINSQFVDKQAILWMYEQSQTQSQIGTGYLISSTYPETAKTSFSSTLETKKYTIQINGNALLVTYSVPNVSPAQTYSYMFTKPASN